MKRGAARLPFLGVNGGNATLQAARISGTEHPIYGALRSARAWLSALIGMV